MDAKPGLRERKKNATRRRIWQAAVDLFVQYGFDEVSVSQIADAADVSKMTVFNYFGSKEDIIIVLPEEHVDDPATAVRDRLVGQTPCEAVREYFLDRLADRDAVSGLTDSETARKVVGIISQTPALVRRYLHYLSRAEERLAAQLVSEGYSPFDAAIVAAQIESTRLKLIQSNLARLIRGETTAQVYPDAVARARWSFDLLADGHGALFRR